MIRIKLTNEEQDALKAAIDYYQCGVCDMIKGMNKRDKTKILKQCVALDVVHSKMLEAS